MAARESLRASTEAAGSWWLETRGGCTCRRTRGRDKRALIGSVRVTGYKVQSAVSPTTVHSVWRVLSLAVCEGNSDEEEEEE